MAGIMDSLKKTTPAETGVVESEEEKRRRKKREEREAEEAHKLARKRAGAKNPSGVKSGGSESNLDKIVNAMKKAQDQ
jgi:hypothetical protein